MTTILAERLSSAGQAVFAVEIWRCNGTQLAVVSPGQPAAISDRPAVIRELVDRHLGREGAVMFRGFHKVTSGGFRDFAASFGHQMLGYDFGSTPRSRIEEGVYSSTEYPAHQWIPQHNEQAYTTRWPMKIWFYCDLPAVQGGETPIADSRVLYQRLDPAIRRRFADKRLMYVRNYGNGLDLPWEKVFQTSDRSEVEAFCRREQIECEWLDCGRLRTRQVCQSEARHPVSGDPVWFNQAHLFHVSSLQPDLRETLLAAVDDEIDLPRNTYYGDGTRIEDDLLEEIRGLYDELMLRFTWQESDILMLDNMLTSHGRAPFQGPRRVLVSMAQPWPA
jgi:alpha-ketoglutarate-dependent taurine dioxygenase